MSCVISCYALAFHLCQATAGYDMLFGALPCYATLCSATSVYDIVSVCHVLLCYVMFRSVMLCLPCLSDCTRTRTLCSWSLTCLDIHICMLARGCSQSLLLRVSAWLMRLFRGRNPLLAFCFLSDQDASSDCHIPCHIHMHADTWAACALKIAVFARFACLYVSISTQMRAPHIDIAYRFVLSFQAAVGYTAESCQLLAARP